MNNKNDKFVKTKAVNKTDKHCVCASCDFRDVVFAYLDDPTIQELCNNKKEQFFRKGEIINH